MQLPSAITARQLAVLCAFVAAALFAPASARAGTATTITVAASSSSITAGTVLTLTATVVAGATQVHPGTILFCDAAATRCTDSAIVGRAQLLSNGTASFKFIPGLGSHTYKARFVGTATYLTSTSSSTAVTVTGKYASAIAITNSGSAGAYTLTGTATTYGNTASPAGTVNFTDASNGNYIVGSATLGASTGNTQTYPLASATSVGTNPRMSATADFNNDGRPDIAVANQNGNNVSILLSNGDGTFTAASGSPIATGNTAIGVVAADFNNDGNSDLMVLNYGDNSISILLGKGDGTFQAPITSSGFSTPSALAVADLNNDGNLDLVITSQSGNVVCSFLNDGTATFTYQNCFSTGSQPYSVAAVDLNGDGFVDLIVGNSGASTLTVLLGDGTGSFTAATGSPITVGNHPQSVVAVDINNDGKVDLVVSDAGDNNLNILTGNGNGTFGTPTTYAMAAGTKFLTTADFNQDGNEDIAVCNSTTSTLSVLLGNGNATFATAITSSIGTTGCAGMVAGDFNSDGLPDIETSLQGNSSSTISLNTWAHNAAASVSSVSIPGNGSHNVFAAYAGTATFASSVSWNNSLTASPITTALTLSAAPTTSQYNQQVTLSASLSPYLVGTLSTAGETITFKNAGATVGTANIASGVASFNITSLPTGTNTLTASYGTDANFLSSASNTVSFTVTRATPSIIWANPASIIYGTALSATQLNATSGGVAGTFAYTPASGTVLNVGNNQTLSVAFTPTDTTDYTNASATSSINVTQAAPAVLLSTSGTPSNYAATVTFTATLPSGASGLVTFLDGATTLGTSTISGTTAIYSTAALASGSHSITASWPGNSNFTAGVSSALTQVVNRIAATITSISSLNPALYGDRITLSATATGSGATPTGTLTLTDNSVTIATLTLDAAGHATYTATLLTVGSHTLKVTYSGDSQYF